MATVSKSQVVEMCDRAEHELQHDRLDRPTLLLLATRFTLIAWYLERNRTHHAGRDASDTTAMATQARLEQLTQELRWVRQNSRWAGEDKLRTRLSSASRCLQDLLTLLGWHGRGTDTRHLKAVQQA